METNEPNPPAEPAYSAPQPEAVKDPAPEGTEVQPEEHEHNEDAYDSEVGTAEDIEADFDTDETPEEDQ